MSLGVVPSETGTISGTIEPTTAGVTIGFAGAGGTVELTGTNGYSGGTTLGSILQISSQANIGGGAANLIFLGGTLAPNGDLTLTCPVTVVGGASGTINTSTGNTTTLSGTLTGEAGDGTITLTGGGVSSIGTVSVSDFFTIAGKIGGLQTLTVEGGGVLTLSGANTYTGGTVLNASGLFLSNNSALGTSGLSASGISSIELGAGIDISNNFTFDDLATVSLGVFPSETGTISGTIEPTTAGVTIGFTGAGGTVELTGSNGYSGGTNLGSILQISSQANIGGGAANLFFSGGTLAPNGDLTLTCPLNFVGTDHGGTINTSTGNTTTLTGTLTGDSSNELTLTGAGITSIGTVSVSDVFLIAGDIGGAQTLTLEGGGNLVLLGANTYTGATHVSNGDLILIGSLSSSTALIIDGSETFDMSGISGSQTVSGLSGAGDVLLGNKTLVVDNTGSSLFSGALSGVGGNLTKSGSGTLTLSGTNTYSGNTTVSQGILSVNGSITSNVAVASSGTLKGTGGTINGNVTATAGATISPGNSIGTLTISGDLNLNGGTVNIEIAPNGDHSLLAIDGNADLTGILNITPEFGPYIPNTSYVIVTSGGDLTHSFTSLNPTPGYLFEIIPTLGTPGQIELLFVSFLATQIDLTNLTGNRLTVATYLNGPGSGILPTDLAKLTGGALDQALDTISPSRSSFATYMSQTTMIDLSDNLAAYLERRRFYRNQKTSSSSLAPTAFSDSRLMASLKDPTSIPVDDVEVPVAEKEKRLYEIWVSGFGNLATEKAAKQNPKFDAQTGGFLLGLDRIDKESGLLGWAIGYVSSSIKEKNDFGTASFNGGYISAYGQAHLWNFFLEGAFWGGYQRISNSRNIFYPGFKKRAKGTNNSYQMNPHLSFGYDANGSAGTLEPFVAADYVFNFESRWKERGASPFNMEQSSKNSSMLRLELGLNAMTSFDLDASFFFLRGTASFVYRKLNHTGDVTAAIVGIPSTFLVEALASNQSLGLAGVEVTWQSKRGGALSLLYTGEFGSGYASNQIIARLGKEF